MVHHVILYSGSYALSPGNQKYKRLSYGASCHIVGRPRLVQVTWNPDVFLMMHHVILYSGSYALSPGNQESKCLSYGAPCHIMFWVVRFVSR